jgi:hypothetical protein
MAATLALSMMGKKLAAQRKCANLITPKYSSNACHILHLNKLFLT